MPGAGRRTASTVTPSDRRRAAVSRNGFGAPGEQMTTVSGPAAGGGGVGVVVGVEQVLALEERLDPVAGGQVDLDVAGLALAERDVDLGLRSGRRRRSAAGRRRPPPPVLATRARACRPVPRGSTVRRVMARLVDRSPIDRVVGARRDAGAVRRRSARRR